MLKQLQNLLKISRPSTALDLNNQESSLYSKKPKKDCTDEFQAIFEKELVNYVMKGETNGTT